MAHNIQHTQMKKGKQDHRSRRGHHELPGQGRPSISCLWGMEHQISFQGWQHKTYHHQTNCLFSSKEKKAKKNAALAFKDSTLLISCPAPLWPPGPMQREQVGGSGQSVLNKGSILWPEVAAYFLATTVDMFGYWLDPELGSEGRKICRA